MNERTLAVIRAQTFLRLALQEVAAMAHVSAARQQRDIEQLQTEMHRSFVTLSQIMDGELQRAAKDA